MKQVQNDNVSGILIQKRGNIIRKELIRKSIHLFSGFIPLFLGFARVPILCALCAVSVFYCIAEILRLKGKKVPVFSIVTETAARKRDQNRFVLGPLALAVGILLTAVFFDSEAAAIGIYALAFGDGLASLAGILFGKHVLPFTAGKTLEGSLTCFAAIFVATFLTTADFMLSCIIALLGMLIELLPLKDFDNLLIPIFLAAFAQYYFHI